MDNWLCYNTKVTWALVVLPYWSIPDLCDISVIIRSQNLQWYHQKKTDWISIWQDATYPRTIQVPYGKIQHQGTIHQFTKEFMQRGPPKKASASSFTHIYVHSQEATLSLSLVATAAFVDVFQQSAPPQRNLLIYATDFYTPLPNPLIGAKKYNLLLVWTYYSVLF